MSQSTAKVDRRKFTPASSAPKAEEEDVVKPKTNKKPKVSSNLVSHEQFKEEIARSPESKKVEELDFMARPFTKKALSYYNKGTKLFGKKDGYGHSAPKKFLTFKSMGFLADALGRQLEVDDLELLLKDEGLAECYVTREKSRAISWAILSRKNVQKVKELTKEGKTFAEIVSASHISFCGSFYVPQNETDFFFVSGALFPDQDEISALRKALNEEYLPRFAGTTLRAAQRRVAKNKDYNRSVQKRVQDTERGLLSLGALNWESRR